MNSIIKYDYSELRGRIREVYHTETRFARELGISKVSLSAKLNGRQHFRLSEIGKMSHIFNMTEKEMFDYFFHQTPNRKDI
jgi:transcriptional regulator with XRE-family HTH domain